jgi:hypothetical protein
MYKREIRRDNGNFWRIALPYCFEKLESSAYPHVWLPLNRNYKPLGMLSRDYVNYDDYITQALVFSRDPSAFKDVWNGSIGPTCCYLYDDGTDLDSKYFPSLQRLLSHKHTYYGDTQEPAKRAA